MVPAMARFRLFASKLGDILLVMTAAAARVLKEFEALDPQEQLIVRHQVLSLTQQRQREAMARLLGSSKGKESAGKTAGRPQAGTSPWLNASCSDTSALLTLIEREAGVEQLQAIVSDAIDGNTALFCCFASLTEVEYIASARRR